MRFRAAGLTVALLAGTLTGLIPATLGSHERVVTYGTAAQLLPPVFAQPVTTPRSSTTTSSVPPTTTTTDHERRARATRSSLTPRSSTTTTSSTAAVTTTVAHVVDGDPRSIGVDMAAARGWTGAEWTCLDSLWTHESGWDVHATNRRSGAYGIPQALPGGKMATAETDDDRAAGRTWRNSAVVQIRWGLSYVAGKYRTPCGAFANWRRFNSY